MLDQLFLIEIWQYFVFRLFQTKKIIFDYFCETGRQSLGSFLHFIIFTILWDRITVLSINYIFQIKIYILSPSLTDLARILSFLTAFQVISRLPVQFWVSLLKTTLILNIIFSDTLQWLSVRLEFYFNNFKFFQLTLTSILIYQWQLY